MLPSLLRWIGIRESRLKRSRVSLTVAAICVACVFMFYTCLAFTRKTTSEYITHPTSSIQPLMIHVNSSATTWCHFVRHTLPHFSQKMFQDRKTYIGRTEKYALLIDDRKTLGHLWSIPWTLHMLGPEWGLQILAYSWNVEFFQAVVDTYSLENVIIDTFEDKYGYGPWIEKSWMRRVQFMLAKQFWEGLRGEHILIIQDHGVPIKHWRSSEVKKILDRLYPFAYIGAPWSLEQMNKSAIGPTDIELSLPDPGTWRLDPGGNGGFSLRRRSQAVKFGVDMGVHSSALLAKTTKGLEKLGVGNEDFLWGRLLSTMPDGTAPKCLENMFAVELLSDQGALGMHNFAQHHSPRDTFELVKRLAGEFYNTTVEFDVVEITNKSKELESWRIWQEKFSDATLPSECTMR